jgi:exodeoxyribonuclease-3
MKLATWNVNSLKVRLPHVLQWLADNPVDVLCLQETKMTDDKFPAAEIEAAGFHVVFSGQKTYNGVAIISKAPITAVVKNNPHFIDEQQRLIAGTVGGVRIICAYVPNGQSIESDKYQYKLAWLDGLHDWLAEEMGRIRNWRSWATTISPRPTRTCTTRPHGSARYWCRSRSAPPSSD